MKSAAKLVREADAETEEHTWGKLRWYAGKDDENSRELAVAICEILPDCRTDEHYHPGCEEFIYVMTGVVRQYISSEEEFMEMTAGDAVVIPPGLKHRSENVDNEASEMLVVYSSRDCEKMTD
ncbi:MAG: cupin domain-containing protein [Planctomycetes bacterium]|nr:cupin domain-containing protein [Planctomycetota bacterium]